MGATCSQPTGTEADAATRRCRERRKWILAALVAGAAVYWWSRRKSDAEEEEEEEEEEWDPVRGRRHRRRSDSYAPSSPSPSQSPIPPSRVAAAGNTSAMRAGAAPGGGAATRVLTATEPLRSGLSSQPLERGSALLSPNGDAALVAVEGRLLFMRGRYPHVEVEKGTVPFDLRGPMIGDFGKIDVVAGAFLDPMHDPILLDYRLALVYDVESGTSAVQLQSRTSGRNDWTLRKVRASRYFVTTPDDFSNAETLELEWRVTDAGEAEYDLFVKSGEDTGEGIHNIHVVNSFAGIRR